MIAREPVCTQDAPAAIGAYSQGVQAAGWVLTSGQLPMTPAGDLISDDIAEATRRSLDNVKAVLAEAGATMADVVKVTIYLRDMADFAAVNEVYADYFPAPPPARSCIEVARLPKDAPLEIEAVAWKQD